MRECGMLLPISSLPSPYGIGAFSAEAYEFVDLLKAAGQRYWQILPLGPTGFGDSPYQSFSAFAGNPYFIDLDELVRQGLLDREECEAADFGDDERLVDYGKLYENRFSLLHRAFLRWRTACGQGQGGTIRRRAERLRPETEEYCLYMAVKASYGGAGWDQWDEDIRLRRPEAMRRCQEELEEEIDFYRFLQIKFEEQWLKLKDYANKNGIRIIGDMPIYVAFDGADSWAHPELFQFDKDKRPTAVAGCPPDGFSADGQLWGNPLYRWEYHEKTGYQWWIKRMEYGFQLYDVIRVDHFRGFDEYYSIPFGSKTAACGHWEKGPGIGIFDRMRECFGERDLQIIAEDLGFLTPSVDRLVKSTGFPGMKLVEFAFDSREKGDYLPHNYTRNCVVYTGTHDNDTVQGWYQDMLPKDREFSREYLNNFATPPSLIHWDFVRAAMASVADLAVIPVQDYLGLGSEARLNRPSTLGGNWRWRLKKGDFTEALVSRCRRMAELYGRLSGSCEDGMDG